MKSRLRRAVSLLVKFLGAFGILALVLYSADLERIGAHLKEVAPAHLLGAFVLLNVSQIFGALRMRYYFIKSGQPVSVGYALALYYVGMFYTLIFPSGFGGDAYKVYLLKKQVNFGVGKGIRLMIANRANGLLALALMMLGLLGWVDLSTLLPHAGWWILLLMAGTVAGYFWAAQWLFGETPEMALGAFRYSLAVQVFSVLTMVLLWHALSDGTHLPEYIILFLLSSILGVLPITIGGLGVREFTFFFGADALRRWTGLELDPELGVALALSYFALSAMAALLGAPWIHKVTRMTPGGSLQSINKNPLGDEHGST